MNNRVDIINYLIQRFSLNSYLEIGVCNPEDCFNQIRCELKLGVDPGVEFELNPVDYKMTSDQFFSELDSSKLDLDSETKWDLIFIDGLHLANQVLRDIQNSLKHLEQSGFIVIHDCNPPTQFHARENYQVGGQYYPWNGTVWKVIYYLRTHRPDLDICVLDIDWGVGVLRVKDSKIIELDNPFYEWSIFSENKKKHLNLISPSDFDWWLEST